MPSRPGKVNFFRLSEGRSGGLAELKQLLSDAYTHLQNREYDELPGAVEIDNDNHYIQAMQRFVNEEVQVNGENIYYWLITISRIDMSREIVVADILRDLEERRRPIQHTDTEGLVADARIIFDPFRNIIAIYSQRGTVSVKNLRRYFCGLVNRNGLRFEIILNEDGYNRLNNLDIVNQISYKIASPNNFEFYANEDRSELQDMKYANEMNAEELCVVLKSEELEKTTILSRIRRISEDNVTNLKALKVDGIVNGVEDSIDLVKNKLIYEGMIEYLEDIDDPAAYGFLNEAYYSKEEYLFNQFRIENIDE